MNQDEKRRSFYFGFIAEKIAAFFLICKFYKIIKYRYKCKLGEIDIIARKGNKISFIEVKARKDTSLMDFISLRQQQRIIKAAEYFILSHPKYNNHQRCFDAIIMNKYFWPKHFKNYW